MALSLTPVNALSSDAWPMLEASSPTHVCRIGNWRVLCWMVIHSHYSQSAASSTITPGSASEQCATLAPESRDTCSLTAFVSHEPPVPRLRHRSAAILASSLKNSLPTAADHLQ